MRGFFVLFILLLTLFSRKHALSLIVSYYQHQSCRLLIPRKTHAKTSMILLVRQHINCGPFLTFLFRWWLVKLSSFARRQKQFRKFRVPR